MKKLVTAILILLVACASEQEQEAFKIIGDYYGAKVTHTKGFSSEVGKETVNYINLDIKGGPYINPENAKQIAAYAAALLYVNLSDDEAAKYTDIQISLFEDETQKEPIYKRTYGIKTVQNIAALSANFQNAEQLLLNGTPGELYDLLVEKYRSPEQKENFVAVIEKMKTQRSDIKSIKLLGAELLINNETKERFLSFIGQIEWGNDTSSEMTIRTTEDPNTKGLMNIDIK